MIEYHKNVAVIHLYGQKGKSCPIDNQFMKTLNNAINEAETKADVLIITGNEDAFNSGVDLKSLISKDFSSAYMQDMFNDTWLRLDRVKIPVIAAVSGYALGGGLEIAMMCDIIIASDNSQFGQPEINFGLIPGLGGTQKLIRLVGYQRAIEICLTGRFINAYEAKEYGIVLDVIKGPLQNTIDASINLAKLISSKPSISVRIIKEMIRLSRDTPLTIGLKIERDMFYSILSDHEHINKIKSFLNKK